MKKNINILYVDDERSNLTAFKASFRMDYNIHIAHKVEDALEILSREEIHIILTDQRMPEVSGVDFLQSIIPDHPEPLRILVTGYADIQAVIDAINKGQVYKYVSKPWNIDYLKIAIDKAYEVYSLRKENKELTKNLLKLNQELEAKLRDSN